MQRVVLPKTPVTAEVTLFSGEKVSGEFFVAAASPQHPGSETLAELLNDNGREFVPFQTAEGMYLINRSTVRTVEFGSPDLIELFTRPDNECIYALQVVMKVDAEQIVLQGFCYTGDLRPENQRPVDLLNAPDMFILFYCDNRLVLCNKNAISHATVE
jgi:hypothetical protein